MSLAAGRLRSASGHVDGPPPAKSQERQIEKGIGLYVTRIVIVVRLVVAWS